jgi:uncharacterized membrane protein
MINRSISFDGNLNLQLMETIEKNQKISKNKIRAYRKGWEQMEKHFLPLLLVIIILFVANLPTSVFSIKEHFPFFINAFIGLFGFAYGTFVLAPMNYGADLLFIKASRDEKFIPEEIFIGFRSKYLNIILTHLLVLAIVVAGLISCLIPGIIFACRLTFVSYLVMDKNLDPVKAVEQSWQMTKGYGWRIFFMYLLVIPILILGLLLLVVGITISFMWINSAFASLYVMVDAEKNSSAINKETEFIE